MIKKLIFVLSLVFFFNSAQSQIRAIDFFVDLGVTEFPKTRNEIVSVFETLTLDVINSTSSQQEVYLSIVLYKDGEWFARTKQNYRGIALTLKANESRTLNKTEFAALEIPISLDDIEFADGFSLLENPFLSILPEGIYSVCPVAYDARTMPEEFQLSDEYPISCGQMYIVKHNVQTLPQIPIDGGCVDVSSAMEPIDFNWTLLSADPANQTNANYTLKLIDITDMGANPVDQMFSDGVAVALEIPVPPGFNGSLQIFPNEYNMELGHTYAWRVEVAFPGIELDPESITESEVVTFVYGGCGRDIEFDDEIEDEDELDACACGLAEEPTISGESQSSNLSSFKVGLFKVEEDSESGGFSYTGTGYNGHGLIQIDFLNKIKIKVDITDVKINEEGRMVEGTITPKEEGDFDVNSFITNKGSQYGVENEVAAAMAMLPEHYEAYTNSVVSVANLMKNLAEGGKRGMPLAIEQEFEGMNIVLGITDMHFDASRSYYHIIVNIPFFYNNQELYISFGGWVCGGPGGFSNDVILHMVQDLIIDEKFGVDSQKQAVLTFNGNTSTDVEDMGGNFEDLLDDMTYIEFNCEGIQSGALNGSIQLPKDKFVSENEEGVTNNEPVVLKFNGHFATPESVTIPSEVKEAGVSGLQWMASITSESGFQYKELEGWSFNITEAVLDFTELENPNSLKFPEGYNKGVLASDEAWNGMFIKEAQLIPPAMFLDNEQNNRVNLGVEIENLLIDPKLTAVIQSPAENNLLDLSDGNIDGWYFSIEQVSIHIVQNDFINGSMNGEMGPPFMQSASSAPDENMEKLVYEAILSIPESETEQSGLNMVFNVKPKSEDGIVIPVWASTAELESSSYLKMSYTSEADRSSDKDPFNIKAALIGNINVDTGDEKFEWVPDAIPDTKLQLLAFALHYDSDKGFNVNKTNFSTSFTDVWDSFELPDLSGGGSESGSSSSPESGSVTSDSNSLDNSAGNPSGSTFQGAVGGSEGGKLQGFDITLGETSLKAQAGDSQDGFSFNVGLNINPKIRLVSDHEGFAASTSLTIWSKLLLEERRIVYDKFDLEAIRLKAAFNSISVDGELTIFKNDEKYGNGFDARLAVSMPMGYGAYLKGAFGRVGEGTDRYTYWYLEAMAKLGDGGVPLGPVSLYAIGGGFYYNMDMNLLPARDGQDLEAYNESIQEYTEQFQKQANKADNDQQPELADVESGDEIDLGTIPSLEDISSLERSGNKKPEPNKGTFAFKVMGTMGLAGSGSTLNMDAAIAAQFSSDSGLELINVNGNAFVMTDPNDENKYNDPKFRLGLDLTYDRRSGGSIIQGSMVGYLKVKSGNETLIAGSMDAKGKFMDAKLYVDSGSGDRSNEWYLYMGNPFESPLIGGYQQPRAGISINTPILKMESTAYFLAGHGVPTELPPLADDISRLLGRSNKTESGEISGTVGESPDMGINRSSFGFAFGVDLKITQNFEPWIFYANLGIYAGLDVNLSNLTDSDGTIPECKGSPMGINGWYGRGRIYAGIEGGIGIRNPLRLGPRKVQILYASAAMELTAGGPNPFYFRGHMRVAYTLLGGMLEGSKSFHIDYGNSKCFKAPQPFAGQDFFQEIIPNDDAEDISPMAIPEVILNIPVDKIYEFDTYNNEGDVSGSVRLKPIVDKFVLNGKDYEPIKLTKTHYTIDRDEYFNLGESVTVQVFLIAKEYDKNNKFNGYYHDENNQLWNPSETVTFKVVDQIDNFQDFLVESKPLYKQRHYFLSEGTNFNMEFGLNSSDVNSEYNRICSSGSFMNFSFDANLYDGSNELVATKKVKWDGSRVRFDFGDYVEPGVIYKISLSCKTGIEVVYPELVDTELEKYVAEMNSASEEVEQSQLNLDRSIHKPQLAWVEQELASYHFGISEFDSMSDKLVDYTWHGNKNGVYLESNEQFDRYEAGLIYKSDFSLSPGYYSKLKEKGISPHGVYKLRVEYFSKDGSNGLNEVRNEYAVPCYDFYSLLKNSSYRQTQHAGNVVHYYGRIGLRLNLLGTVFGSQKDNANYGYLNTFSSEPTFRIAGKITNGIYSNYIDSYGFNPEHLPAIPKSEDFTLMKSVSNSYTSSKFSVWEPSLNWNNSKSDSFGNLVQESEFRDIDLELGTSPIIIGNIPQVGTISSIGLPSFSNIGQIFPQGSLNYLGLTGNLLGSLNQSNNTGTNYGSYTYFFDFDLKSIVKEEIRNLSSCMQDLYDFRLANSYNARVLDKDDRKRSWLFKITVLEQRPFRKFITDLSSLGTDFKRHVLNVTNPSSIQRVDEKLFNSNIPFELFSKTSPRHHFKMNFNGN